MEEDPKGKIAKMLMMGRKMVMRRIGSGTLVLCLLWLSFPAAAEISGKLLESGSLTPIADGIVALRNSETWTTSDPNGRFSLPIASGTVVITGAASGIGQALAWRYARSGARLGLLDMNAVGLDELRSDLEAQGGETMAVLEMAMIGQVPYTTIRDAVFAHPTLAESLNNLFMNIGDEIKSDTSLVQSCIKHQSN